MSYSASVEQAVLYLRENITNGTWPTGSKIPPYRYLATHAHVSPRTMIKAIGILQKEKLLCARQGSGIYVGSSKSQEKLLSDRDIVTGKWNRVKETVKQDILNGSFAISDNKFSIKELMVRYNTSYHTIKKVMDDLTKEKIIDYNKRAYQIKDVTIRKNYYRIYLVMKADVLSAIVYSWDRMNLAMFTTTLELECSKRNIQLIKCSPDAVINLKDTTQTLGFIVWQASEIYLSTSIQDSAISHLLRYKKPIAIINMSDINEIPETKKILSLNPATIKQIYGFISTTDYNAGFALGRFLFGKGHRKICFFGYSKSQQWPVNMCRGIDEAFISMNVSGAVVPFFCTDDDCKDITLTTHDKELCSTFEIQEKFLIHSMDGFEKQTNFYPRSIQRRILDLTREFTMSQYGYRCLVPFMRKALSIPNVTAWVGSDNHFLNFTAPDFLKAEKIKVPEQLGLAGFSTELEASFNNLTSFNANYSGIAHAALNVIIYPELARRTKGKNGSNVFTVEGFVVDRGSA